MKNIYAIIVAAGRGRRFGDDLPKQYHDLCGRAVLYRTLKPFIDHPAITGVRVLIHPDDEDLYREAVKGLPVMDWVAGGATRQESVFKGLDSLRENQPDLVLIHDAARPFVSANLIDRVINRVGAGEGVIPALPVSDTLKREEDGHCTGTVDRDGLWRAQTPQGFLFSDIMSAHDEMRGCELTDDAAVMEAVSKDTAFVEGGEDNFKITTREDLTRAKRLLDMSVEFQNGTGFDVHRFAPGEYVTLCGVEIAHSHGLSGHSDADVALHALTDAILGAIAEGDIGSHFPPSDNQWKGASSDRFLKKACDLVTQKQGQLVNLDVTIICERPKIGPHRDAMRQRISEIAGIDIDRVSVKGTTTEKLGFTGRGEGIAAQASATVKIQL